MRKEFKDKTERELLVDLIALMKEIMERASVGKYSVGHREVFELDNLTQSQIICGAYMMFAGLCSCSILTDSVKLAQVTVDALTQYFVEAIPLAKELGVDHCDKVFVANMQAAEMKMNNEVFRWKQ